MTGIQITCLASGLDTQQVAVQARQNALRQIDTKLTDLKLAAIDLRSALLWTPVRAWPTVCVSARETPPRRRTCATRRSHPVMTGSDTFYRRCPMQSRRAS
jgi:hypothetical protein